MSQPRRWNLRENQPVHNNVMRAFEGARTKLGLSITDIARKIFPPEKLGTHAGRVHEFFRTGKGSREMALAIAEVVGVTFEEMVELSRRDHEELVTWWNQNMDEPIRPFITFNMRWFNIPPVQLPANLKTEEEMIRAATEAKGPPRYEKIGRRLWLSRRLNLWLDGEGKVERRIEVQPDLPSKPFITPQVKH